MVVLFKVSVTIIFIASMISIIAIVIDTERLIIYHHYDLYSFPTYMRWRYARAHTQMIDSDDTITPTFMIVTWKSNVI